MGVAPDVSVIIVNWNLKDDLRSCLSSIQPRGSPLEVETIVVDNGSGDGSLEMIRDDFPDVTLISNHENLGFAHASNQGMEAAAGRYLFLLNNDALLKGDCLALLVKFMDDHPDVGICGPRVVSADGTLQVRSKGFYPSISTALEQFYVPGFLKKRSRRVGFYEPRDLTDFQEIEWLSGCALMGRGEALEAVGLLDEETFTCFGNSYCDDVDWCYRMNKAGWKVMYVPEAEVLHHGGKTMKELRGKVVCAHAIGLTNFFSKHHGRFSSVVFNTMVGLGYSIQAAGWVGGAIFGQRTGYDKLKRLLPGRKSA